MRLLELLVPVASFLFFLNPLAGQATTPPQTEGSLTTVQESQIDLLRPPPSQGALPVRVGFYLTDVNTVDEEHQRFEVEGTLTVQWQDDRMAFDPGAEGTRERIFQGNYQFTELATGWWPQIVLANESGMYERQAVLLRQRSDGHMTYVEEMNAVAEMPIELRRFPFDREHFQLVFEVLGFSGEEVRLEYDPSTSGIPERGISIAEWKLQDFEGAGGEQGRTFADGGREERSVVAFRLELARNPGFALRVVVLPMTLLVILSWSVFWMDRESLGNRMDISFIGVLTVVAYQIMVASSLPRIPYFTLMSAFIYVSFFTVAASVLVNLVVGRLDHTGRRNVGNRVDEVCRWAFPAGYVSLLLLATSYFFLRY